MDYSVQNNQFGLVVPEISVFKQTNSSNQFQAVSRTQELGTRKDSIKTLPFAIFHWILKALCLLFNAALCLTPERNNDNIKYLISSSRNRTHDLSRIQSHFVPMHHDGPQKKFRLYNISRDYIGEKIPNNK